MNKKILFSITLSVAMLASLVFQAVAGSGFDVGTLEGEPAVGEANWVAWFFENDDGIPAEILTDENTNSGEGDGVGYSIGNIDPLDKPHWLFQVENFSNAGQLRADPPPIRMIFGGLGAHTGSLWKLTIPFWNITETITRHGEVPVDTTEAPACPVIVDQPIIGTERVVDFAGEPGATYHVYRSRNASGAENGLSNGQYFYIATVTVDVTGLGKFSEADDWTQENWYLVIQADPETNSIIGCRSQEGTPSGEIAFTGEYNEDKEQVDLSWTLPDEDAIADLEEFNILRSTNPDDTDPEKINDAPISADGSGSYEFADDDLGVEGVYYYWLEVVDDEGNVIDLIGPIKVEIPLEAEIIFEGEYNEDDETVDLTWTIDDETLIEDLEEFNILRSTDPDDTDPEKINDAPIPADGSGSYEFADDDLGGEGVYYYWLEVVDDEGNVIDLIGPIEVKIPQELEVTFEGEYNEEEEQIDLNWTVSDEEDIDGFLILRSTDPNDPNPDQLTDEPIPADGSGSYEFVDDDLEDNVDEYYYWLAIVDDEGNVIELIGPIQVKIPRRGIYLPIFYN